MTRLRSFALAATALAAFAAMAIPALASATERIVPAENSIDSSSARLSTPTTIHDIAIPRSQRGDRPADGIIVPALYMKPIATFGDGRTIV